MLYQIDVDITEFSKFQLQDVYALPTQPIIKLHCDDGTFIKAKLKESHYGLNLVGFFDDEFIPKSMYANAIASISLEFNFESNLNLSHVDVDKIMTTRYKDFEQGTYLVVIVNLKNYNVSFEILETYKNYTAIAGCFGFDVEKDYKVLSYIKIKGI